MLNRRRFFQDITTGIAGAATATLLGARPHHAPRAKQIIQIHLCGAVSQMDTFDYKPALEKFDGQPMPGGEAESFQGKNGAIMRSPWGFHQKGQTGKWVTDMLPFTAELVDDMAFIHSMTAKSISHSPGCLQMNTGFIVDGFPSVGAWVSYALGSLTEDLPTFVALPDPRGVPVSAAANWGAGFLPAQHQAVAFSSTDPIQNLDRPRSIAPATDLATRRLLSSFNERHAAAHPGNSDLAARIKSLELAARMQLSVPNAVDINKETKATRELYGADDPNPFLAGYARNCILARRLVERGVRFVQLNCGAQAAGAEGQMNWDAHKTLKADYERHFPIFDRPTAGLLRDLKLRGLLKDTLVVWTTEFGRLPTRQEGTVGRDHNPDGFTVWMMGAGVKPGASYGQTDDFGRRAVENAVSIYDLHATILHLLGLDHEKLTYYHNGFQRRLTDVHGHVIREILA
jgi:hypothetical protein